MTSLSVRFSPALRGHLERFEVDGATVASLLFEGGRLQYHARRDVERLIGHADPYTLEHEARAVRGLNSRMEAAVRFLGREALSRQWFPEMEPTLELLWRSHAAWVSQEGPSLDRIAAALVMTEYAHNNRTFNDDIERASELLVSGLHSLGFPPTLEGLEELFDGAYPACVGLGLVEL
jgi:hypothetical protein